MSKSAVLQFLLNKLRSQAASLTSLKYLKVGFLGLTSVHPLFRSCRSSPWEVEKATTQLRLLSGRYRLESLCGHWTPGNKGGLCTLLECWGKEAAHKGTIEDFLLSCPSLFTVREKLVQYNISYLERNPHLLQLVVDCLKEDPVQFWLDCSTMPGVIAASQLVGSEDLVFSLFKMTRNYCHGLHTGRLALLVA